MSKTNESQMQEISCIARINERLERCKMLLCRGHRRTLKERLALWEQVELSAATQYNEISNAINPRNTERQTLLPMEQPDKRMDLGDGHSCIIPREK